MKKWVITILCLSPVCAVATPNKPYDIIHQIVITATDNDVVAYGTHNDALIKTYATQPLRAIYAQKHDSDFLSHYTILQMGGTDTINDNCYINFIFDSNTEYRLFCGNVSDYKTEYPTVTVHQPIQINQPEYN